MKIYLKLPGGGKLTIEREPMNNDKFSAMWIAICIMVVAMAFFGIFK